MDPMDADSKELPLFEALERHSDSAFWKEYKSLKPFEAAVFVTGLP